MSVFYIEAVRDSGVEIYKLNATTDVSVSRKGKTTEYPVEDGFTLSDAYSVYQPTIRFSGVITDVMTVPVVEEIKRTEEYLAGIESLMVDKIPVTFFYNPKLSPLTDCFIEQFSFSQNKDRNTFLSEDGTVSNSFNVEIQAKQIISIKALTRRSVRAEEIKDVTDEKESGSVEQKEFGSIEDKGANYFSNLGAAAEAKAKAILEALQ